MLNLRLNLGIGGSFGVPMPPFKADLTFDWWNRTSGTLVLDERVSDDDAAVVGGVVGVLDEASIIIINTVTISGDFEITFCTNTLLTATSESIFYNTSSTSGFRIRNADARMIINGANTVVGIGDFSGNNQFTLTRAGNQFTIVSVGDFNYTNTTTISTDSFTINLLGGRSTDLFLSGDLSSVNLNNQAIYPLNGNAYDSISGVEATWSGTEAYLPVTNYTPRSTQDALDLGYWQNDTTGEQVINKALNTTGLADTTGWTEHEGGKMHNLVNSYVCLNPTGSLDAKYDILDRINQTAASTDSVYYDSTDRITRSTYHITELDYDVLQTFFEVADQNKVFVGFKTNYGDKLENFEVFVYENQKSGADLVKVLEYINYVWSGGREWVTNNGEIVYNNDIPVSHIP